MSFISYQGTPYAPWLLPIIPVGAPLSERSKIEDDNVGKIPGQFYPHAGAWSGFGDWTRFDGAEKALPAWDRWYPDGHQTIGLNSRLFPGIDADVNASYQAFVVQLTAFRVFGETIVRGREGSPRQLLMYRLHQPGLFIPKFPRVYADADGKEFKVEILGKGQQYLIEGDHPKGGRYVWVDGKTPLSVDFQSIPCITPEMITEFIKELDEAFEVYKIRPVMPKQLRGNTGGGPDASAIGPNHPEVAPALAELRRLLGFIPVTIAEFEGYDDWEKCCRAIKTACGGDEAFYDEVYLPWQLENPDNDDRKVRQKWESHTDSKLGWNYLCNIAGQYGYVGSTDGLFEPLDDDDVPAGEASADRGAAGRRGPVPKPLPEDFALHTIPRRQFVLGRRFMAGTVTLGVAAPGAGKSNVSISTALAIATGHPLTGEDVHRTGPVWIHNNEDSLDELYRRVGGMLKCRGINLDEFRQNIFVTSGLDERLIVAFKSKDIVKRTEAVADFIAAIKERGIVHVVIDPLVSTHLGVSENSNEEIEQVMETIRHIAHETGCSIDLIHHSLKSHSGNTEAIAGDMNAARGASSLIGAARMVYTLAPMSERTWEKWKLSAAQAARLVRLDQGKGNYAARDTNTRWFELEPFDIGNGSNNFETDAPLVLGDTIAVPKPWKPPAEKVKETKATEREGKLQLVRDFIAEKMPSNRCLASQVFEAIGDKFNLRESAVRALLKHAIPEGEDVPAEAKGHIYQLTIEKELPSPPGRLYVVRRESASLAEAA